MSAATCNPDAANWNDSEGMLCADQAAFNYCTADGDYGTLWDVDRTGKTFANFENGGYTALNCPECGCVAETTTTAATTKGI